MTVIQNLPYAVAKSLLVGQPLELMDGDVGNVPIHWIKSVFKALQNSLGDVKVFTVSILGLQSSGKSTLLNSMFGLQFAVSAGRCTSGIYMQMIPVIRELSSLQFDYALIVDTEGLRASELSGNKQCRDNELATLVIGVADFVIINVKGENIAELENILQISVHGMIRLKQANPNIEMKQSCKLVHQNVSAQDAEKRLLHGHHKTMKSLDEVTKGVAFEEGLQGIDSFNDVIKFDPMTSIVYICDLWHGTPPMTPVSPQYCSKVDEVKESILDLAKQKYYNLTDTLAQFEAVWTGILKEDFVFCFRNCIEVKAYNLLEERYKRLTWGMEDKLTTWFTSHAIPKMERCDNEKYFNEIISALSCEMVERLQAEKSLAISDLLDFIHQSDLKEFLIQWKENKNIGLVSFSNKLEDDIMQRTQECKRHCIVDLRSRSLRYSKEKEINERAKALADEFKGKDVQDSRLFSVFENILDEWIKDLEIECKDMSEVWCPEQLKESMISVLFTHFHSHKSLVENLLANMDLDIDNQSTQQSEYDNAKAISDESKALGICNAKIADTIEGRLEKVMIDTKSYMSNRISQSGIECTSKTFLDVLRKFADFLQSNAAVRNKHITYEMEIEKALELLPYCYKHFTERNIQYFQKRSVRYKLEQYKQIAYQLFLDTVKAKTKEHIAANAVCGVLKDIVFKKLLRELPNKMKGNILSKYTHTKHHLIKDILEDLATNESLEKSHMFDQYVRYIRSPDVFANEWLTNKIKFEIFEISEGKTISKFVEWTDTALSNIVTELELRADQAKDSDNLKAWITTFCTEKDDSLCSLQEYSFSHLTEHTVTDFSHFHSCIVNRLKRMQTILKSDIENITPQSIEWPDEAPYDNIFETLWGCRATCPWCGEPCQNATEHKMSNEPHRCIQHRPGGVSGVRNLYSEKLVVESCNFQVQSSGRMHCGKWCGCTNSGCAIFHPFIEYKTYMPMWDIAPSSDMKSIEYWAWFMATYSKELAREYWAKEPDIPISWNKITKEDAVRSLSRYVS